MYFWGGSRSSATMGSVDRSLPLEGFLLPCILLFPTCSVPSLTITWEGPFSPIFPCFPLYHCSCAGLGHFAASAQSQCGQGLEGGRGFASETIQSFRISTVWKVPYRNPLNCPKIACVSCLFRHLQNRIFPHGNEHSKWVQISLCENATLQLFLSLVTFPSLFYPKLYL